MSTAILFNAPAGVVGDVTRKLESNVESFILGEAFPGYGVPFKLVSGKPNVIDSGDAASVFKGILVRTAPSMSGSLSAGFDDNVPNIDQIQGGLVRGYCAVKCSVGTPVRGGQVYMRVTAASGKLVGDLEATADGSDNVALSGVEWAVDGKDANGISEIRVAK